MIGLTRWENERGYFYLYDPTWDISPNLLLPRDFPGSPQIPRLQLSRVQIEKWSQTRFESATFRLTVVRSTTLGKMVVKKGNMNNWGAGGEGALHLPIALNQAVDLRASDSWVIGLRSLVPPQNWGNLPPTAFCYNRCEHVRRRKIPSL
jgi:hypothetical protein